MKTLRNPADRLLAIGLAALAFAVFAPVLGAGFILLDDQTVFVRNPNLAGGLTLDSLRWAFTGTYSANWYPLTWVSHLAVISLFGLDPRAQHLANLLLHAANAALFFTVILALTGRRWTSALAAALFAVHPLRAEVVGWATSRTDVLSGLFWLLAMLAWAGYARRPGRGRYAAALALFACGLMAKPSVVTLPLALLVLDWWPLGRLRGRTAGRLLLEKVPFFLLAGASAVVTVVVQQSWGAMGHVAGLTPALRLANALVACLAYLRRLVWPTGLAILYPHPGAGIGLAAPLAALAVLAAVTALAVLWRGRRPWLLAAWLWFLATILPMAGIVQVGVQATADRYTYLTQLLLAVAAAWALGELAARRPAARALAIGAASCAVLALAVAGHLQAGYWVDDVAVFGRAVAVTRGNWLAHVNLGAAYGARGDHAAAREQFLEALRIRPDYPMARENLRLAEEALARARAAAP